MQVHATAARTAGLGDGNLAGQIETEVAWQDGLMAQNTQCRICSRDVVADFSVRLWDGHWYCRDCMQAVSPTLYDYAIAHEQLEESAPFHNSAVWRNVLRLEAWIVFSVMSFFAVFGFYQSGLMGVIVGILITLFVTAVQAAIQLPMFVWLTKFKMPTTIVANGQIHVYRGACKKRLQYTAPLQHFQWRIGHSRQDTELRNTFVPKQPVVLLLLPRSRWTILGKERIACGWTQEMQLIWRAFLSLAGVSQISPSSGKPEPFQGHSC